MAKKSTKTAPAPTSTRTGARINPKTMEVEPALSPSQMRAAKELAEAKVRASRAGVPLCKVCGIRIVMDAASETCNAKECPSYTPYVKARAEERQAELAASEAEGASGGGERVNGLAVGDSVRMLNSSHVYTIKYLKDRMAVLSNGSKTSVMHLTKVSPTLKDCLRDPQPDCQCSKCREARLAARKTSPLVAKLGTNPLPAPASEKRAPASAKPAAQGEAPDQPCNHSVGFRWRSADGFHGIVYIEKEGKGGDYLLTWVGSTAAWVTVQLMKLEPGSETRYTVSAARVDGQGEDRCGCKSAKNHGPCKHVKAVRALVAAGKL